ncbi:MAG: HAMP domain-containing histidine kinase [Elusimicrobia bacterium]|nr:HAMP domain-containing histidine kinase [Elusimicrobiota bacterium]
MGITGKLTALQAAFAALIAFGTLVPVWMSEQRYLADLETDRQNAEVERFARVCSASPKADAATPLAYLQTMVLVAPPGSISYAAFLGADGKFLLHTDFLGGDRTLAGKPALGEGARRAIESPSGLRQPAGKPGDPELVSSPVFYSGAKRVGTALIAYDSTWLDASAKRLRSDSIRRAAMVALPGLAAGLLAALALGRALTEPIRRLAAGAREVGRGKLDTRIESASRDELGDLAREFNGMAAKLAELDEMKDSFFAQITHDLRNPLSATLAYISLMESGAQGPVTDAQRKSLRIMEDGSLYLNELIGNILDLSKLEAGRLDLKPARVDLKESVSAVLDLQRARALEYGVALESRVADGAILRSDADGLKRVLMNLATNALKFTPKGGTVTVSHSVENGFDRVEVSDTGIGIPAEKIGQLFKKFSQIDETRNVVRDARGTGLGLVICKQLVEAHGGSIGVRSVYKQGTTFFFLLPRGEV